MGAVFKPEKEVRYFYSPQEDITTHEVAQLLPFVMHLFIKGGIGYTTSEQPPVLEVPQHYRQLIEDLPEALKKHFTTERPR